MRVWKIYSDKYEFEGGAVNHLNPKIVLEMNGRTFVIIFIFDYPD